MFNGWKKKYVRLVRAFELQDKLLEDYKKQLEIERNGAEIYKKQIRLEREDTELYKEEIISLKTLLKNLLGELDRLGIDSPAIRKLGTHLKEGGDKDIPILSRMTH